VLEAEVREMEATYDSQFRVDLVKAEVTARELAHVREELTDARNRREDLTVYAMADGTFFSPLARDLEGKFAKRGEVLGYVLDNRAVTARVVISQSYVDLVRHHTKMVHVRLPERLSETVPASLVREVPAATDQLPSRVLGQPGGGEIAIDPRDTRGTKAFQKIFLFDIQLPPSTRLFSVGGRVYVRMDHGWEPLVWRWYRGIRELLLKRFNV